MLTAQIFTAHVSYLSFLIHSTLLFCSFLFHQYCLPPSSLSLRSLVSRGKPRLQTQTLWLTGVNSVNVAIVTIPLYLCISAAA